MATTTVLKDKSKQKMKFLNPDDYRKDFPILNEIVHGKPLIYFDNGASTQKPLQVINTISDYYLHSNANVHRGIHALSEKATAAFEESRKKIARFINASSEKEIIFTRGTTEAINLVASAWGRKFVTANDEIILSEMEHHSNLVPLANISTRSRSKTKVYPIQGRWND